MSAEEKKEKKVLTKAERTAKFEQLKKERITEAENTMNRAFDNWANCRVPCDDATATEILHWFSRRDTKVFDYWYDPDLISAECVAKLKQRAKELGYDDTDVDIKNGKLN